MKPCTGRLDCPVPGHVRRWPFPGRRRRIHALLTPGSKEIPPNDRLSVRNPDLRRLRQYFR